MCFICYRAYMAEAVERIFLIAIAFILDTVQFILNLIVIGVFFNPVLSIAAAAFFSLFLHGNPRWKLSGTILTFIAESTPLGVLPLWTIRVWWTTRDKGEAAQEQAA